MSFGTSVTPAFDIGTILEPMITLIMMVMVMKMMTKMMEDV